VNKTPLTQPSLEERAKAEICGVKPSSEGEGLDEGEFF